MYVERVLAFTCFKDKLCQERRHSWQRHLFSSLAIVTGFLLLRCSSASKALNHECSQNCSCPTFAVVKCVYESFTKIPNNISKSILSLDLSWNPALKINNTSFTKYIMLKTLILVGCNLSMTFIVPRKVRYINLSRNKLSYEHFHAIFSGEVAFVRDIDVSVNKIHIINRQPLLNMSNLKLQSLVMSQNFMRTIYNDTFQGFRHLKRLFLESMEIETIERGAFRDLSKLAWLSLLANRLSTLPRDLFKPVMKLTTLDLRYNKLQAVPDLNGLPEYMEKISLGYNCITDISTLSEIGVKRIRVLSLWHNNITTLPKHVFQKISALEINLAYNKITKIQDYSFTACSYLSDLYLDSNSLVSISEKAFSTVQHIARLSLSNNKLRVLPPRLFANLSVKRIFLFDNNISSIESTWKDIRSPPDLVLLFQNPIKTLSTESLEGLGNNTVVHLSCDTLSKISRMQRMKPVIRCSPYESFYLMLPATASVHVLQEFGFNCKEKKTFLDLPWYNCTPCSLGYHGTKYDRRGKNNLCKKCPAGSFYQDKLVQTSCKRCPKGQYVPLENTPGKRSLDCLTCPAGTQSNRSANYRACFCLPGFARLNRFGPCRKCTTQGISCEKDYRILKPGFWWSWEYNATCKGKYQAFIENLETFNDSYTLETTVFLCEIPLPHKCPNKIACLGNLLGSCHENYTGPLCALCAKKYYRHFKMCVRCPRTWIVILEFLAYLLAFVFICILINWADKIMVKNGNDNPLSACRMNTYIVRLQKRKQRTVSDVILSTLKIVLGFYQVLNGTVHSFPYISWPRSLTKALSVFQYIQLEILRIPSLRCIKPEWDLSAIDEFLLSLGVTVLIPFLIGIYYVIRKVYLDKIATTQRAYIESIETCKKHCVRSVILFLFSTFPSTLGRIFQILPIACHQLCLTASKYCISYLRADYSIKCPSFSSESTWILYTAYASLIIPFGFVIFLMVSLAYVRHLEQTHSDININDENDPLMADLIEPHETNAEHYMRHYSNQNKQETTFQFTLRFCHENYQPSCWYWEITEILRKVLFISILPQLSPFSNVFLGLSIILAGFFALLHAYKKPIQNHFEHWLQMVSLSVIPANLCIAYIFDTIATQHFTLFDVKEEKLGISAILIVLNSAVIVIVMLRYARAQASKLRQLCQQHRCNCRCCLACMSPCVEPEEVD